MTQTLQDHWHYVTNFLGAAMYWIGFGLKVIPVLPGRKRSAVNQVSWFSSLNLKNVKKHWTEHPGHEIGFILSVQYLVIIAAESLKSVSALAEIEDRYGLKPKLVVKTARGEEHYFRRSPGTNVIPTSLYSGKYSDPIGINKGGVTILPPCTGKSISILEAENMDELSTAGQEFLDSIYLQNGMTSPSELLKYEKPQGSEVKTGKYMFEIPLKNINPDNCRPEDWRRVGMAIFHETKGSQYGRAVFYQWCNKSDWCKGFTEIDALWRSFRLDVANPETIGTLIMMAAESQGYNTTEYLQLIRYPWYLGEFWKNMTH